MHQAPFLNESPLNLLIEELNECDDFRDPNMIDYPLVEILFLAFCGSLCGCQTYEEIVDFGELKLLWLGKFLPYKEGIPERDTIRRAFGMLNPKQLEKVLINFSKLDIKLPNGSVLNMDGKWLSRSATIKEQQTKKSKGGKQAVNMVNVYCSTVNSCLASLRVSSKEGEKDALEDILSLLDLSHCMITMDAGYCYRDVAEKIVDKKADYLIGLKANQPKLLAAAQDLLKNCPAVETYIGEEEDSHGRLEQRTCKVINFSNLEQPYQDQYGEIFERWKGLDCLIQVVCKRTVKSKNKTSAEARYYISSKEQMPKKANEIVRGHWRVENSLHWMLDVHFGEDKSTKRAGNSAQNFSIIRKMAFNKLKTFDDPKVSMKRKLRKCALDEEYLEKVLKIS